MSRRACYHIETLRQRAEGAAIGYLESEDAAELIEAAGLEHLSAARLLQQAHEEIMERKHRGGIA